MMTKPDGAPGPIWNYYFLVNGAAAAVERIKAGGGQVLNGPMEVPGGGWVLNAVDPQGALFSLLSGTP
jgi:predicted enzyme related to lactoylglutathione lyase